MTTKLITIEEKHNKHFKLTITTNEIRIKLADNDDNALRDRMITFLTAVAKQPEFRSNALTFRGNLRVESLAEWDDNNCSIDLHTDTKDKTKRISYEFFKHDIFGDV